jgi:hypothetical protein
MWYLGAGDGLPDGFPAFDSIPYLLTSGFAAARGVHAGLVAGSLKRSSWTPPIWVMGLEAGSMVIRRDLTDRGSDV